MSHASVVCCWTVVAGFEPDTAADRFTRTFVVSHQEWAGGDLPGQRLRAWRHEEAVGYASMLMADGSFSWVNLEYRFDDGPSTDGNGSEGDA